MQYLHYSFNDETLNDKSEQENFPTLIDQRFILNENPSKLHNVEIPSQLGFLEHVEPEFDHDDPIFDYYFVALEFNMSINVSTNDPIQYEISDLNA
jgi:hypothetical protein